MPIIETPHPDSPLSQGDILGGLSLFATAKSWVPSEACPRKAPHSLCLVLSRPCNLQHKPVLIVAAVERYNESMPRDIESFDEMLDFLTAMRDGNGMPDVFYLGQLPGVQGRHCCRFYAIFSIEMPTSSGERNEFATKHRIGSLSADFLRDLHLRLFRAFASLGFDDHSWLSTPDLDLLVSKGQSDILKVEQKVRDATTAKLEKEARGEVVPTAQLTQIGRLATELEQCRQVIAPCEQELQLRRTEANGTT